MHSNFEAVLEKFKQIPDAQIISKDGGRFLIHKMVLSYQSEYFRKLFNYHDDEKEFNLPNIEKKILEQILVFLYTKQISLSISCVPDLLIASDFLLIDQLISLCCDFSESHMDIPNCLPILAAVWKIEENSTFFKYCYRFAQLNFRDVIENSGDELRKLDIDLLKVFLSEKSLNISSENIIWHMICTWIEHDLPRRSKFVPELLTYINMENVDAYLATSIIAHPIVSGNDKCNIINNADSHLAAHLILGNYVSLQNYPIFPVGQARTPSYLSAIATIRRSSETETYELFMTFDEKFDACKKICDLDFFPIESFLIGHKLYLFGSGHLTGELCSWDLVENIRIPLSATISHGLPPSTKKVMVVNRTIYFVNISEYDGDLRVARYEPEADEIVFVAPLPRMSHIKVSTCGDKIYAFGHAINGRRNVHLSVHEYDSGTDKWTEKSKPNLQRKYSYGVAEYLNKLVLFGGNLEYGGFQPNLEEYDPATNSWKITSALPVSYRDPKCIISNDIFYIYETSTLFERTLLRPPVIWNEEDRSWQILRESSPFFNLKSYLICPINNSETVKAIIFNRETSGKNWSQSFFT